jgi:translin
MPQEVLRPEIVERLEESLERLEEARESLLRDGRDAMLAIRRAIARVHSGDEEGARAMLEEAGRILRGMKERADADLERYVLPVEAEYVEASAFRDLAFGAALRGADELGVDPRAYVLGLLDAVGECRRLVYDSVREGDLERAGRLFEAMDDIYSKLMHMVVYDRTAGGLKRKLDAAKISLDDAARILTEARLSRRATSERPEDRRLPPRSPSLDLISLVFMSGYGLSSLRTSNLRPLEDPALIRDSSSCI